MHILGIFTLNFRSFMNTMTTVIFAIIPTDEIRLCSIIITVTLSDISVEDEGVELHFENSEIVFR